MNRSSEGVVFGAAIPSIVRWGQSPDSDLVYRALLMLGPRPAGDLRRTLGLSGRRIVTALDELAAIDAVTVRVHPGQAETVWSARPPETLLESLRSRRRPCRPVAGPVRQPGPPAGLVPPVTGGGGGGELGEGLRHLPSRAATRQRLVELARFTRYEHLAMNTEAVFEAQSARPAVPVDRELLQRGVRMRVLGRQRADGWDPLIEHGRRADDPRPDYRQAEHIPMKLILIDRRVALFPVAPNDFDRGFLEVSQEPVVAALVSIFDRHWDGARGTRENAMPQITLDDRERALVTLLAQGHTDTTAARELRVSPRTVSNILRTLMDRVGVENRFQLGLALGAARTVPPAAAPDRFGERS